jgi:hypothetical protein
VLHALEPEVPEGKLGAIVIARPAGLARNAGCGALAQHRDAVTVDGAGSRLAALTQSNVSTFSWI